MVWRNSRRTLLKWMPVLFVGTLLAISVTALMVSRRTEAQPSVTRYVVGGTGNEKPDVARTIDQLRQRGFVARSPADVPALASTGAPKTLVFTASGLAAVPQSVLNTLYWQGTVIAALDVEMPALLARIGNVEPRGPIRPPKPPECNNCWLKPSPSYTLFSLVATGAGWTRKTSERLSSTNHFLIVALERAERDGILTFPTPRAMPTPSP